MEQALPGVAGKVRGRGEERRQPLVRFQYDDSVSHLLRDVRRGRAVTQRQQKDANKDRKENSHIKQKPAAKDANKDRKENSHIKQKQRPAAKAGGDASQAAGRRQAETVRTRLAVQHRATTTPSLRFEPTP